MPKSSNGREDLGNLRLQFVADTAAVTAKVGITPSNNGAVLFQCREGVTGREDLRDTGLQISADGTAVTAISRITPGNNGAIIF